MELFILKKLLDWKNSPYRKPLILKGVRQVGKTWILKEFGRRLFVFTQNNFVCALDHLFTEGTHFNEHHMERLKLFLK